MIHTFLTIAKSSGASETSGVVFVILTAVYTIASIVILYLSHRANKISQQTIRELEMERIAENRPYINLGIVVNKNRRFELNLQNMGRTIAHNVKLTFENDLIATRYRHYDEDHKGEDRIRKFSELAITDKIPYIAPGRTYIEIINYFAPDFWKLNDKKGVLLGVIEYYDDEGNNFTEKIDIDLGVYFRRQDLSFTRTIDDSLQRIERSAKSLTM